MIGSLLNGLVSFLISIIKILLNPIETLITNNIPSLSTGLAAIGSLIDYIIDSMGFVLDVVGLSSTAIALIIAYWSFALTLPVVVWAVKVVVKWWHALVP